jgi:hypothetical protein
MNFQGFPDEKIRFSPIEEKGQLLHISSTGRIKESVAPVNKPGRGQVEEFVKTAPA